MFDRQGYCSSSRKFPLKLAKCTRTCTHWCSLLFQVTSDSGTRHNILCCYGYTYTYKVAFYLATTLRFTMNTYVCFRMTYLHISCPFFALLQIAEGYQVRNKVFIGGIRQKMVSISKM